MKKHCFKPLFCSLLLLAGLVSGLSSCSSDHQDDAPGASPAGVDVVGTFQNAETGRWVTVRDITPQFSRVSYANQVANRPVTVSHVPYGQLPQGLRETVKQWAVSFNTCVFRLEWQGRTVYHLLSAVQDVSYGIFDDDGRNLSLYQLPASNYASFVQEATNVECILITVPEAVKSAAGAPNLLVGSWQTDMSHLLTTLAPQPDVEVSLYPQLSFTMRQYKYFKPDGTGLLLTVKAYDDGREETGLDPFRYEFTDYRDYSSGICSYSYRCYFEGGDTIEYTCRTDDGFVTMSHSASVVTFPWYKLSAMPDVDPAAASSLYTTPQPDAAIPIVGRWEARGQNSGWVVSQFSYTWVFRADHTGYVLFNGVHQSAFAWTASFSGHEADVKIYKFDTGYYATEALFRHEGVDYFYDPTVLPQAESVSATFSADGRQMELSTLTYTDADMQQHPLTLQLCN